MCALACLACRLCTVAQPNLILCLYLHVRLAEAVLELSPKSLAVDFAVKTFGCLECCLEQPKGVIVRFAAGAWTWTQTWSLELVSWTTSSKGFISFKNIYTVLSLNNLGMFKIPYLNTPDIWYGTAILAWVQWGIEHWKCLLQGPCFFTIFKTSRNNMACRKALRLHNQYNHSRPVYQKPRTPKQCKFDVKS